MDSGAKKYFAHGFRMQTLFVLPVLMFMLFSFNLPAQNAEKLGNSSSTIGTSSNQAVSVSANTINSLVYGLHSTIFIENGIIKTYGNSPAVVVDIDANSLNMLYQVNPLFNHAELIKIRINSPADFNKTLNLTNIPSFTNLKYVQYLCSYDCGSSLTTTKNTSSGNGISVFYNISIPN